MEARMDEQVDEPYRTALDTAERLLGFRLEPFFEPGPGEPVNGADFTRLATLHAFGDAWPRQGVLDLTTRALVSVAVVATLGTVEPLRGQLRIALNNGVTPAEIAEVFIQLEAYAGAARAYESYRVAREVFAERAAANSVPEEAP
jgi:4-carboxymuconolactone decarboxylase